MLLFPTHKTAPAPERIEYCTITAGLQEHAVRVLNTFDWLQGQMDSCAWKEECHVQCKSRKDAEKRAKLLRNLRLQKQEGIERPADDTVYRELLVEMTAWFRCTVGELLVNEADIYAVANQIHQSAASATIAVEKRVRRLAQAFLKLCDGMASIDVLAGYESPEITASARDWADEVLKRHAGVMDFLRLFDSRCSAEKAEDAAPIGPIHAVIIEDLNTVNVDGTPLKLNRAKKGALFTLAVIGCENIAVEAFAKHYNDHLNRNPGKVANYANIFNQALSGLRKKLPNLVVTKPEPHLRSIFGIDLTSMVDLDVLAEWLAGRTSD